MESKLMISIPQDVLFLLEQLNAHGYEAYIVGGCVRDSILRRSPQDWDITTSALPEQTKALFPHTFDTGIQHGTITVVLHRVNYEITTYRIDGAYADCRHPDAVSFAKNLTEDLLRRDFTMNAIAYHPQEGFRDPFHGQEDIALGVIRGVGEPARRFQEDALRMLRCVRFAAQLGFSAETQTWSALCENVGLIQKISVERIREELEKIWLAPYPEKIPLLWESGLLAQIDPLLDDCLQKNQKAILQQLPLCPRNALLRWCIILQSAAPEDAEKLLRRMKVDNHTLKRVCLLLAQLAADAPTEAYPMRKQLNAIGTDAMRELLALQALLRPHSAHAQSAALLERILADGDCLDLKTLCICGKDLMQLGVPHGRQIGEMLGSLLDMVLREPEKNTKEILTAQALALRQER